MSNTIKKFLSAVEPFTKLPPAELENLANMSQETHHIKGETVYSEGDEAQSVWVLVSGRAEIFKYSSDGKPTAIETISPKGIFGMYCRIGSGQGAYPCTSIASVDSTSICIPDKVFWPLFQRSVGFVTGICTLCSQRLNGMQDLVSTSQEPVQKRIVKTLFTLSKESGPTLMFTKREIAELSSTTVETTIRTLSALEKKNWISSERGQITLKNHERLQALLAA